MDLRALFRKSLEGYGVNTSLIPAACLNNLAEHGIQLGQTLGSIVTEKWESRVIVEAVESEAATVASILAGTDYADEPMHREARARIVPILERNGIRPPAPQKRPSPTPAPKGATLH